MQPLKLPAHGDFMSYQKHSYSIRGSVITHRPPAPFEKPNKQQTNKKTKPTFLFLTSHVFSAEGITDEGLYPDLPRAFHGSQQVLPVKMRYRTKYPPLLSSFLLFLSCPKWKHDWYTEEIQGEDSQKCHPVFSESVCILDRSVAVQSSQSAIHITQKAWCLYAYSSPRSTQIAAI